MKRVLILFLCLVMFAQPLTVSAPDAPTTNEYVYWEDGGYFITTLTVMDSRAAYTKTASKTTTYYNENGVAIWALHLTGDFYYDYGVRATATDAQANVTIYNSSASTQICDAYTSGSAAFGYAAVRYKNTYTEKEISINCDKYGNVT